MSQIWSPLKVYEYLKNNGMKVPSKVSCTRNFLWTELLINQTEEPSLFVLKNLLKTTQLLQKYRASVFENNPIIITSGWRSPNYNQKIGGTPYSYHMLGMALDFTVSGFSPRQVQILLDPVHKGGLEFAPTWTHIDIRRDNIRFDSKGLVIKK